MGRPVSEKVIAVLLDVYSAEIGAIGTYMDQHTKSADAGYKKFAEQLKEDAEQEMKHAEELAERILFVGGTVKNMKHRLPVEEQTDVVEMIRLDIEIEIEAIKRLNSGIAVCMSEGDHGTRLLLEKILKDEERHVDEYETLLDCVEKYGDGYIITHLM